MSEERNDNGLKKGERKTRYLVVSKNHVDIFPRDTELQTVMNSYVRSQDLENELKTLVIGTYFGSKAHPDGRIRISRKRLERALKRC